MTNKNIINCESCANFQDFISGLTICYDGIRDSRDCSHFMRNTCMSCAYQTECSTVFDKCPTDCPDFHPKDYALYQALESVIKESEVCHV